VQAAPKLRLDAADVDTLTLPCAQIIMAALASQAEVTIQRPSQAFLDAFSDFGIDVSMHCVGDAIQVDATPEEIAEEISIAPEPQPAETATMSKRILTIDDSKTIRDMLRLTLLDAGFEVHQAVDGEDGVGILDKEKFDVVITDINMPKMDGYGVIRHMRSVPEHRTTPILVLTTESEGSKRNLAREAGATGWMVKPFDPEQLVATIYKVAP
jgi:two-component system chemotaxis response regulator CheY